MAETKPLLVSNKRKPTLGIHVYQIIVGLISICIFVYFFHPIAHVSYSTEFTTSKQPDTNINNAQKILIYYSLSEDSSNELDLSTLIEPQNLNPSTGLPYITHISLSTIHLKLYDDEYWPIHLNDYFPDNKIFNSLQTNIINLHKSNIFISLMIGGWEGIDGISPYSDSSFINLFNNWDIFYPFLLKLIKLWNIDGIDIDIENCYDNDYNLVRNNYKNIIKLIKNLRSDLGNEKQFIITFSPVVEAIYNDDIYGGLSGFNYKKLILNSDYGEMINWLNLQFYNEWGKLGKTKEYKQCVNQGYSSNYLVAGMLKTTDIKNDNVISTINELSNEYGDNFGGVYVYQGNSKDTIEWSRIVYSYMHQK